MERVSLVFHSSEKSGVEHELTTYANTNDEIYLQILPANAPDEVAFIALDLHTAIRLVKHLKKEIGYIKNKTDISNG